MLCSSLVLKILCDSLVQIIPQQLCAAGVAQLAQGLGLDLADAFTGDVEELAHFFQGMVALFGDAETLIALKDELFRTKSDRHSNQFTTSDGKITVALGYRTNDGWDDTVNVGVDKVKTFIKSLAKDEDSAALTEMVMNLLAKDRKGNLKASRVLQLREIARKSGYPQLIEATDIIQNAYRPVDTCQFISVSYKDDKGVKQTLPLSLAAME